MALFGLIFLIVALTLIGAGIALGLVASAIALMFVGLGVVSSSLFIGVRAGRATTGIRAFLLQCGILAGIPAGAVCALVAQSVFSLYGSEVLIATYGALGGAVAGVVIALFFDFVLRRLYIWSSTRFASERSTGYSA